MCDVRKQKPNAEDEDHVCRGVVPDMQDTKNQRNIHKRLSPERRKTE